MFNKMINNESYVVIGGWMLNNLKLKGNELLVFATIYSFTNGTDEHCYKGSARYLSERCGLQRRQVMNVLKSLEDKGYIERKERTENGVKFVDYYTPYANFAQGGYANFAHHNDSIDNDSKKEEKEKVGKTELVERLKPYGLSTDVINRILAFDKIKKGAKISKMNDTQLGIWVNNLKEYGFNNDTGMIKVIENSIANGWQGIFELKGEDKKKAQTSKEPQTEMEYVEMYHDYYLHYNEKDLKNKWGDKRYYEVRRKRLEWCASK